jgi:hypothetical protein
MNESVGATRRLAVKCTLLGIIETVFGSMGLKFEFVVSCYKNPDTNAVLFLAARKYQMEADLQEKIH